MKEFVDYSELQAPFLLRESWKSYLIAQKTAERSFSDYSDRGVGIADTVTTALKLWLAVMKVSSKAIAKVSSFERIWNIELSTSQGRLEFVFINSRLHISSIRGKGQLQPISFRQQLLRSTDLRAGNSCRLRPAETKDICDCCNFPQTSSYK